MDEVINFEFTHKDQGKKYTVFVEMLTVDPNSSELQIEDEGGVGYTKVDHYEIYDKYGQQIIMDLDEQYIWDQYLIWNDTQDLVY